MKTVIYANVLLVLCLLSACTSAPVNERHYVLGAANTPSANSARSAAEINAPVVLLNMVDLADFLNQPQLVMQLNDHKLQKAYYHFWAEPLQEAVTRELLKDLRKNSQQYRFEQANSYYQGEHRLNVHVSIDQFHPSDQSRVNVSGQFYIIQYSGQQTLVSKDFSFQAKLNENGYAHAIKQLRALLAQLSVNIVKAVETSAATVVQQPMSAGE